MAEHGERVKAATTAAALGELQHLVADLQTAASPVQLPDLSSRRLPTMPGGWGLRAAAAGVLVVLGIAIGWGLDGNTPSPLNFTSDPGAKSDGIPAKVLTPPRQLHSLGGLNGLFEQMAQKWGDTMGYSLTVYPDYASLERPDPDDERRVLRYVYRGGWGDPCSSTWRPSTCRRSWGSCAEHRKRSASKPSTWTTSTCRSIRAAIRRPLPGPSASPSMCPVSSAAAISR